MYDQEPVELLRAANDNAGEAWLKGYVDAYQGRDVNTPELYATEYLRGFIAGLQALRN